jgi:hypothetical protein
MVVAHESGVLYATVAEPTRAIGMAAEPTLLSRWGAELAGKHEQRSTNLDERDRSSLQRMLA